MPQENWKDIHKDFAKKNWGNETYQQKWEEIGLTYQEAQELTQLGFKPTDYDKLEEWKKKKFGFQQIKEWVNAGAKIDDYDFIIWLNRNECVRPWILDYLNDHLLEEYREYSKRKQKNTKDNLYFATCSLCTRMGELWKEYKDYGLCKECWHLKTSPDWCRTCSVLHLQENFKSWTSGNQNIDRYIQEHQLKINDNWQILEWIPYEQFADIEYLAEGGFGKVYKAKWIDSGPIRSWNIKNGNWTRGKDYEKTYKSVALKSLNNSQNITTEFLREITYYKSGESGIWIVPCYGISQDPERNYIMVMDYMEEGNLRQWLDANYDELEFIEKLYQLSSIAGGLNSIHEQGLIHRDLHVGNILQGNFLDTGSCCIADLGLCKPANEANQREEVYGVLPYMAPEVLRDKRYASEADIYSFGMIAYEILSGLPTHYNIPHDQFLTLKIFQGLRPNLKDLEVPQLLENLIEKCWDANPTKRPTAYELSEVLHGWYYGILDKKNTKFCQQYQAMEAREIDDISVYDSNYKIHSQAIYTSRLLDFKNLPEPQNSQEINDEFYSSQEYTQLIDFAEIGIQEKIFETEQKTEQTPQIIHKPT